MDFSNFIDPIDAFIYSLGDYSQIHDQTTTLTWSNPSNPQPTYYSRFKYYNFSELTTKKTL